LAYAQYTQCITPASYSGPINYIAGGVAALIAGLATLNFGVATTTAILVGIAWCRWWLYGRLVCLGGNQCCIGLALELFPPQEKTGLDREDTDYSVNLLLAPSTLYEGLTAAGQDIQGFLLNQSKAADFQAMMSNYSSISNSCGLGFTGEPEPLSALVNPSGQSPDAGTWQPDNFYLPGAVIQDPNSNLQNCITEGLSGGSMPSWQSTPGETTPDNNTNWVCMGRYAVLSQATLNGIGLFFPSDWAAATSYAPGDLILDSNGNLQSCAAKGQSGATPPTWNSIYLQITYDGTVAWQGLGPGKRWSPTYLDSTSYSSNVTSYIAGDVILDAVGNQQKCIVGGRSGSVTPAWATVVGGTTNDAQVTWQRVANVSWENNTVYPMGAQIVANSTGQIQTCTTPGQSGPVEPTWAATIGQTTADFQTVWTCIGESPNNIGTIEIEFEGAGIHDLYLALLVALPIAIVAAVVGEFPVLGWLLALLLSLLAAAIAGIGYAIGQGDIADPNADDPAIGTIYPGKDVLVVMGTWIYDSAHAGWNELHPVLHCQKIATVQPEDLASGNPWGHLPDYSAANLQNTLNQISATRIGWCPLIQETLQPTTLDNQQLPQNQWTIHPAVDGCTPSAVAV
jgi:hypothetical protein